MVSSPMLLSPEQLGKALPAVLKLAEMHFVSQCLYTAVKLGISNIIGDATMSVKDIVAQLPGEPCLANEDALLRCMRMLATQGVFLEVEGQNGECLFALTPTGALLQTGLPQPCMASGITHLMEGPMWAAWSFLPNFVAGEIDKSPFEAANGQRMFDYHKDHPEIADPFHEFKSASSTAELPVVASEKFIDWPSLANKTVVDVGGSLGFVMSAVAGQFPDVNCVSFDLPEVIERATEYGVYEDVTLASGDAFDAATIPKGDVIFMKHVLNNWQDDDALRILKGCSATIPDDGKVIVVEGVLPNFGASTPGDSQVFAYDMLSMIVGGKERTQHEWDNLAQRAGLKISQVTKTPLPRCQVITMTKC